MKSKNTRQGFTPSCLPKGFTLIELLVVVLIIGILSAVALPQYQKAVGRSRGVQIATFLKEAQQAIDLYILENGYQDQTFYDSYSTPTINHLDLLTKDLSALVEAVATQYDPRIDLALFGSDQEAQISLGERGVLFFGLVNGKWDGICETNSSFERGFCETVHQTIPEIKVKLDD